MAMLGNNADKSISKMQDVRRRMIKQGMPKDQIKMIDDQITATMKEFNNQMKSLK
jgi:hypothetical protein